VEELKLFTPEAGFTDDEHEKLRRIQIYVKDKTKQDTVATML